MPRDQIINKKVSFTPNIAGTLIGKGRHKLNKLQEKHPKVRITTGAEDRHPCFVIASTSLDAVNNCINDINSAIMRANAKMEQRNERKRVEREREKARSKLDAEKRIRENIVKEMAEKEAKKEKGNGVVSQDNMRATVKSSNPFGVLLDDNSDDDN